MKAIFIIGTGRSGTHFTVRSLKGFKNTFDPLGGNENHEVLMSVAKAAIHHQNYPEVAKAYFQREMKDASGVFLDQHHPNIFFLKELLSISEEIVFLYPFRPTYQVVASMLRHEGVLSWYSYATNWRQRLLKPIPFPNQFLGVQSLSDISKLPLHLLCAYRVLAHQDAFQAANLLAPKIVRKINYEALVSDASTEFLRIFKDNELKVLGEFKTIEPPQKGSLVKYLDVLSEGQISEIKELERNWPQ